MDYLGNCEPLLEEMLDDPIVHLVMARDRLALAEVRRMSRRRGAGRRSRARRDPVTRPAKTRRSRFTSAAGLSARSPP